MLCLPRHCSFIGNDVRLTRTNRIFFCTGHFEPIVFSFRRYHVRVPRTRLTTTPARLYIAKRIVVIVGHSAVVFHYFTASLTRVVSKIRSEKSSYLLLYAAAVLFAIRPTGRRNVLTTSMEARRFVVARRRRRRLCFLNLRRVNNIYVTFSIPANNVRKRNTR